MTWDLEIESGSFFDVFGEIEISGQLISVFGKNLSWCIDLGHVWHTLVGADRLAEIQALMVRIQANLHIGLPEVLFGGRCGFVRS